MTGHIPQHFIDQLLNRIDIVDLIDGYLPLKRAGANYKANCPFHGEKTPSFTVSPSKQFYHCFGCGAHGSAISFLMEYDHMEFREAIEKLASGASLEIPTEAQSFKNKLSLSQGIDLYKLMHQISDYYQAQLRQHSDRQQAVDYLQKRGLSGEVAKRFGLGFAPDGWDKLMSELGATAQAKKALLDTGMLTQNDNQRIYDRFRHRIMFPIADHRGRIVGFGGRVLGSGEPKYLNSPETPIFHKGSELYGLFAARAGIKEVDGVLVVEGYMDVVALAQAGINNAVATLGTATTPTHLQRLIRHTKNITFSFDGDRAGKTAAWKALETCLPMLQDGYQVSFLFLPDGEDPDTMVKKIGKEKFLKLIENATPLPNFLINTLQQRADLKRLDGRARLAQLAQPMIQKISSELLRQVLVEEFARLTQIAPQILLTGKAAATQAPNSSRQRARSRQHLDKSSARMPMTPIRWVISILLQNPELAQKIPEYISLPTLQLHGMDLFRQIVEQCLSETRPNTAALVERHRQEKHFSILEKLASHDHLLENGQIEPAFLAVLQQLQDQSSEVRLEQLLEKSRHETLDDKEKRLLNQLLSGS